jgi:hypothetical protein
MQLQKARQLLLTRPHAQQSTRHAAHSNMGSLPVSASCSDLHHHMLLKTPDLQQQQQ